MIAIHYSYFTASRNSFSRKPKQCIGIYFLSLGNQSKLLLYTQYSRFSNFHTFVDTIDHELSHSWHKSLAVTIRPYIYPYTDVYACPNDECDYRSCKRKRVIDMRIVNDDFLCSTKRSIKLIGWTITHRRELMLITEYNHYLVISLRWV